MIVFTESFDHYGTDVDLMTDGKWTSLPAGANNSLVAGGGRCGTVGFRNGSSVSVGPRVGLVIGDQFSWGQVAIFREEVNTGSVDIAFHGPGSLDAQFFFRFMTDGSIEAWQGPNTTLGNLLGQSAPAVYSANTYFVFEWEVLIDPIVGTFQAWIDGAEIIALTTGQNTQLVPAFGVEGPYSAIEIGFAGDYRIDDGIFGDGIDSGVVGKPNNRRIGPVHLTALIGELDSVASGGFYKQFTPLSGTDHGAMIDDNPPDADTTYNFSAAAVLKDTYTFPDIKIGSGSVFAVNILPMVKKSDAMNTRQIKPMFRLSGVDTLGTLQAVPDTQYEYRWEIVEGRGTTAWTVADLNATQFGLEDSI